MRTLFHCLVVLSLAASSTVPAQSADKHTGAADTLGANRQVILELNGRMNRGEWRKAAELFGDDVTHHGGSSADGTQRTASGKEQRLLALEDIFRTFPDWRMEIIELVAQRDLVVTRSKVSGTHRGVQRRNVNGGALIGLPPTGKRFEIIHTHWYRIRDGKIVEHWASRDDLGMARQLGVSPPPAVQQ